jgi:hypothetical protein
MNPVCGVCEGWPTFQHQLLRFNAHPLFSLSLSRGHSRPATGLSSLRPNDHEPGSIQRAFQATKRLERFVLLFVSKSPHPSTQMTIQAIAQNICIENDCPPVQPSRRTRKVANDLQQRVVAEFELAIFGEHPMHF